MMQTETQSVWNSLEIFKLIVAAITPIVVGILVWKLNEAIKRFEHRQWRNQKLIEKRLEVYDKIAPKMNDLLCYFTYVGCWKDLAPDEVVKMKRQLDKEVYLAMPLFSPEFFSSCMDFMNLCYETYTGVGQNAKLRTKFEQRGKGNSEWSASWDQIFSKDVSDPKEIRQAYKRIINCFSEEIGLASSEQELSISRVPNNIK